MSQAKPSRKWLAAYALGPWDSDQRTAKRTSSTADFNFSFALMFERCASTVLMLK